MYILTNIHCSLSAERSVIIASVKVFFADMTQLVISGRIAQQTGEIPVALIMRRERHRVLAAGIQLDHGAVRKVDRPGITGVLRSAQDDRMAVQKQIVVEFPFLLVGEELLVSCVSMS